MVAKRRMPPECPSPGEWVHTMLCIYTVEDDSTLKRKDILTHATAWTNPKDTMHSELRQSRKDKY